MRRVNIDAVPIDLLAPVLGADRFRTFARTATAAGDVLTGRAVLNVNSTAIGGGVAEMLPNVLAYARGTGIDVRWAVIDGPPEFFTVTKRVHNHIYGNPGDGLDLGAAERFLYERVLADQAHELLALVRSGDVVVLHDPQTLGLARTLRGAGARVVWRCHIGADQPNSCTERGWQFLARYFDDVDRVVVSLLVFAPPGFPAALVDVIPPSIDPLAVKNLPLAQEEVARLLAYAGLLQARPANRLSSTAGTAHRRGSTVEPTSRSWARLRPPMRRWSFRCRAGTGSRTWPVLWPGSRRKSTVPLAPISCWLVRLSPVLPTIRMALRSTGSVLPHGGSCRMRSANTSILRACRRQTPTRTPSS